MINITTRTTKAVKTAAQTQIYLTYLHVCSLSSSAPGVREACWSDASLGDRVEQSSTMPRAPPRASRQQRRASDASLDADVAPHDDLSENSRNQTPVKAGIARPASASNNIIPGQSASVSLGLKAFSSPAAAVASPSNASVLAPTNTRRIGSKFCIDLVKGWFDVGADLFVSWCNSEKNMMLLAVVVSGGVIMIKR